MTLICLGRFAMILRRFFRGFSVLALWGALLICAVAAAELDVRGEMRFYAELYPKNSMVSMLSVRGHMRTHMTGLMGEPVLNHQIRLDPYPAMFLRFPDGRIRSLVELPPEVQKAAQKVRFTLVGSIILGSNQPQYHMKTFIPFDSGASVSPGEGNSFNVPGSPAWGRLFRTELCGSRFLDEQTARQIAVGFEKKTFWLASADMCSEQLIIDDSALRTAISAACTKGKKGETLPDWCPKSTAKAEPAKGVEPGANDKGEKNEKAGKDAPGANKGGGKPGKASALDELDKHEIARIAPPPPPPAPAKTSESKPEPKAPPPPAPGASPASAVAGKTGKVIFQEDFKVPKGWQGRYEAIESPGCAYLGAAHAGIHMAFSPGGPIWREVAGFTPGQAYEVSFEVRTLDPGDAGKAKFLVDDKVLHAIRSNGKVSVKFTASQTAHRIKFDWKVQSIKMAPVHVTNLRIAEEGGMKDSAGSDLKQYVGKWTYWNRYRSEGARKPYVILTEKNGKLQIEDYPKSLTHIWSWEVIQQPEIKGEFMFFTIRGIDTRGGKAPHDYRYRINLRTMDGEQVLMVRDFLDRKTELKFSREP